MTHQEKEALLKRIYALPTEWADAGGSYGKGGTVGSDDAAMLWPEAVIDAINQFAADANVALSPWVKTSDRLPDKCDCYTMYLTTKKRNGGVWQVRGIFIKEHPELCPWWMPIPPLPEVEK